MKEKLGPFRIYDKDGYLIWEGELKEFVLEDEYGRRWVGKIKPVEKKPTIAKVSRRKRGAPWKR